MIRGAVLVLASACCLQGAMATASAQTAESDLSTASLESLTQIEISVSSFARRDEDLWKTPAAVFVITREDIERSTATSVPELLRSVPGMQVAQIDASSWAVSARGFNSEYANKLQVLIDGRTMYSEIESGAHWDQTDLPLDTVERIEVIRGPGAAVWGANAVNGVINIITRRARNAAGVAASARIGRIDGTTTLQYGGAKGDRLQYRGYANYTDRRPLETSAGQLAFNGEDSVRGGGRMDWQRTAADWITLSGDIYGGHFRQQIRREFSLPSEPGGRDFGSIAGGYLLGRWEHKLAHSDTALQVYYDDTSRREDSGPTTTRTIDTDFQSHLAAGTRNDLVWGSEVRLTANHIGGAVAPTTKTEYHDYLINGFVQDEITLRPNRLLMTLGAKIEQGSLAGFQFEPSMRALWSPTTKQSAWAAVSRAVRAPAIEDKYLQFPLNLGTVDGLPVTGTLLGDPGFEPETVLAYEAGYRRRMGGGLTLDVAGYFNVYRRLEGISVLTPVFVPSPSPHEEQNLIYVNGFQGKTAGVEAALSWRPLASLSVTAGYGWMQSHITRSQAGDLVLADAWAAPRNAFTASAWWSFARTWSLNGSLYLVDGLPNDTLGPLTNSGSIPAYQRLDLHLVRRIGRFTEIDAGGTNLLTPRHLEFGSGNSQIQSEYVPRSLFVKAKWTF